MNIFVLNSGRCGSTTFIKACSHISNYSSGHESRIHCLGSQRLNYPKNHIEADNRLSWFLGRLDQQYGDNAFYVHLIRDTQKTLASFSKRQHFGIMKAYQDGIYMNLNDTSQQQIAKDYLQTINANIHLFLKDKSHTLVCRLENAKQDFEIFWQQINAQGQLNKALHEWDIPHNKSK